MTNTEPAIRYLLSPQQSTPRATVPSLLPLTGGTLTLLLGARDQDTMTTPTGFSHSHQPKKARVQPGFQFPAGPPSGCAQARDFIHPVYKEGTHVEEVV